MLFQGFDLDMGDDHMLVGFFSFLFVILFILYVRVHRLHFISSQTSRLNRVLLMRRYGLYTFILSAINTDENRAKSQFRCINK